MKPPSEWLTPKYSAHTNTLEQSPHHCHIQRTNKYEKILCVEILLAVIAGLPVAIIDGIVWKAFWKLKKSYWQEILRLLACPSQQYQKNEMYLPSGRGGSHIALLAPFGSSRIRGLDQFRHFSPQLARIVSA